MEKPALPEYEEQRLMALDFLGVLDTPPDEGFDRLTRLIKYQFDVPIVLISLIAKDRQWIKSGVGLELIEIPRELSFSAHTILEEEILHIPDATKDPRFNDNPYVTGEPGIRFYAGVPLSVEGGLNVGTLSIIDTKPRTLSGEQFECLRDIRSCVEQQLMQARLQSDANFLVSQTSRLNTLLETIADGIVTIDSGGQIESLNTQAAHIFGYEPQEILGRSFTKLMPDLGRGGWNGYVAMLPTLSEYDVDETERTMEVMGLRKDNTLFPMDLSVRVMYLEGKQLFTGIIRDVTARKSVEDELKKEQELLEITKENIPVGIGVFDANQNLIVINHEAQRLFNLPADHVKIGTPYRKIVNYFADRGDLNDSDIDRSVKEWSIIGKKAKAAKFHRTVDGGKRIVEVSTKPMPGGGIVAIYSDITERLKSAEKLESLLYQANAANQAKTDFLSTISHEIRTPLNGVIGMTQMLGDTDLTQDQREKLDIILKSGNNLLELINNVLDMSKIETGHVELEKIACDVKDLFLSISVPFEAIAKSKGVAFHCCVSPKLADCHMTDPTRLRQIVSNLVSNALKFTEKGRVELSVNVDDAPLLSSQIIVVTVSDTGVGVPKNRLSSIFDSFSQADNSVTRKFGGTGLGLSIVKNLVTLMNGNVEVTSNMGEGSCFTVNIPLEVASGEEARSLAGRDLETVQLSHQPMKILVAEDNDVNLMITEAFLKKLGHHAEAASNGREAVQMMDDGDFDLILMDVHMPEMDGVEATRLIRANSEHHAIPIIGLTADAFKQRHSHFRDVGMNDVLTKPFTEDQLKLVLTENIDSRALNTEADETDIAKNEKSFLGLSEEAPIGSDEKFHEFSKQLGSEVVGVLIEKTPESVLVELGKLRDGLENKDSKVVLRAAHTMYGVAGSMCSDRLAQQAAIIEKNSEQLAEISAILPIFEKTIDETIVWWSTKHPEKYQGPLNENFAPSA